MKEFWTPAELADLALPDLPKRREDIARMADREGWRDPAREYPRDPAGLWMRRDGRGGGYAYRYDVLPSRAKRKLLLTLRKAEPKDDRATAKAALARDERWDWFERLPAARRRQAEERLAALNAVADLVMAGKERDVAMMHVAAEASVSLRTLYNWAALVHSVPRPDWLPYLQPRHAGRQAAEDNCTPEAWEWFKGNYLRQSGLSAAHCYRQLKTVAAKHGWRIPSCKTLERRIAALDETTRTFLRHGEQALKKMYPAQERDRSALHALEAVNADGHKWDVFVRFPDGEICRPCMVGFQDIYSGMILSWRVDKSENKAAVRLAFGDLVETYGIPDHVVFDNGRNFASKWITGGSPTRYRFKVKDDEPAGVVTELGCTLHWATPFHGQAKPIERAWRDFAGNIARDVRFEGAWTGNNVAAKPENYGTAAVPLALFLEVVSEGVIEHNARLGRRSKICAGDSFADTFATSYQASPIRQASPAQRRLWLLPAESVTARRPDGALYLAENRYWAEFLVNHIGQKLVMRIDPQALHQPAHVYRLDGAYLGTAACIEAVGFFDTDAARSHARARNDYLRAAKAMAKAERKLSAADVAALMPKIEAPEPPETKVVRPFFGNAALALAPANDPDLEDDQDANLAAFGRAVSRLTVIRNESGADD